MLVILGNQLFAPEHLPRPGTMPVYMAEDVGLCTYERHHQQKIVLFLAAMRAYADELREAGHTVHYHALDVDDHRSYEARLRQAMREWKATSLHFFEIEDKPMEVRLSRLAAESGVEAEVLPSPMFTCSRKQFAEYAASQKRLRMGDFYKYQRCRLGLLVDDNGEPAGGRWSFDTDNRKRLPKSVRPPAIPWPEPGSHVTDVIRLVESAFPDHPGRARDFRWPVSRQQARAWLEAFVRERLRDFGPYEDAMTTRSDTVFHSLLSPYLNLGLLTPAETIERVMDAADRAPLQSVEGFLRQVIGWREFVRGIYREYGDGQASSNFWSHERELTAAWYDGSTGLPPLDHAIRTAQRLGWMHHIERLMVVGNLMTLCEIRPQSAHRWFMEMCVDSSEWVMGPNVYGMALFSDGGLFATKPYVCGSNYLLKMSDYARGPWCDVMDGLYWRFIDRHRDFFAGNPRLALMPRALDRLESGRRRRIFGLAEEFLERHTA